MRFSFLWDTFCHFVSEVRNLRITARRRENNGSEKGKGDVKDKHTYRENDRERDRQNVVKPYTRVYSCTFNIFLQRHLEQRVFLLTEFRIANSTTKEKTITGSTYVNR